MELAPTSVANPSILRGDCRAHRAKRHRPFQSGCHVGMDVSRYGTSETRWTVRRAVVRGWDAPQYGEVVRSISCRITSGLIPFWEGDLQPPFGFQNGKRETVSHSDPRISPGHTTLQSRLFLSLYRYMRVTQLIQPFVQTLSHWHNGIRAPFTSVLVYCSARPSL